MIGSVLYVYMHSWSKPKKKKKKRIKIFFFYLKQSKVVNWYRTTIRVLGVVRYGKRSGCPINWRALLRMASTLLNPGHNLIGFFFFFVSNDCCIVWLSNWDFNKKKEKGRLLIPPGINPYGQAWWY